jgi:hypothetical protein
LDIFQSLFGVRIISENCHKPRHTKGNCYHLGGGKEGQAPSHWKLGKKKDESANVAKIDDDKEIFAFTCSSDFQALATTVKQETKPSLTVAQAIISAQTNPSVLTTNQSTAL